MAIELPPEPVRNTPITAEWGRKVVRALRALCPVAGSGMIVDIAPGGTTYRLSEMPRAARRSQLTLRAWQPKFLLEKENANSSGASAYRLAMRVGSIAYLTAEGETQFPEVEAALTGTLNAGKLDLTSKEVSAGILYLGCERSAGTARWVLELGAADLPLAEADSEGTLRFRRKALAEIDPDNRTVTALVSGGRIEIRDPATGGGSGGTSGAPGENGADGITWTPEVVVETDRYSERGEGIFVDWTSDEAVPRTIKGTVNIQGPVGTPGADGSDGAPGADGEDGVGIYSITTTEIAASSGTSAGTKITITLTDGTSKDFTVYNGSDGQDGANGSNGSDGAPGADGEDGIGIDSITTTPIAASSGTPAGTKITITLTDGTSKDFTIYNGSDGQDGADGEDGGAADLPEPVELTVVTGIQYEENKLTMTTQVVKAYLAETPAAETATTIFTATPHSEEHS